MAKPSTSSQRSATARRKGRAAQGRRNQSWIWIVVGVVVVLVIGFIVAVVMWNRPNTIAGLMTFDNLSRNHTQGSVTYPQTPPVGGDHNPVWQNCGIYDQPVKNENAVHSLEHGAVWITYQPDLPADQVAQLRSLVQGRPYTLLSPYPNLPGPIFASAWGVQLKVDNASDSRLPLFISRYAQGPQTPEPGAACSGGIGTPISH